MKITLGLIVAGGLLFGAVAAAGADGGIFDDGAAPKTPPAATQAGRRPVPDAATRATLSKLFLEAYATELAAPAPAARRALAQSLIGEARKVGAGSPDRFVVLRAACARAARGGACGWPSPRRRNWGRSSTSTRCRSRPRRWRRRLPARRRRPRRPSPTWSTSSRWPTGWWRRTNSMRSRRSKRRSSAYCRWWPMST